MPTTAAALARRNDWFNKAAELQASDPNNPSLLVRNTFGANVGGPSSKPAVFLCGLREPARGFAGHSRRSESGNAGRLDKLSFGRGGATLTASQIAGMDPNCSTETPVTCPARARPNPMLANIAGLTRCLVPAVPGWQYKHRWAMASLMSATPSPRASAKFERLCRENWTTT